MRRNINTYKKECMSCIWQDWLTSCIITHWGLEVTIAQHSISFLAVDDDDDNIYSSYMSATSFGGGPMSLYEQAGLRYYYNCFCGVGAAVGQWLFLSHSNHMYCRLLHSGTRWENSRELTISREKPAQHPLLLYCNHSYHRSYIPPRRISINPSV